jgi:hypothetical protein
VALVVATCYQQPAESGIAIICIAAGVPVRDSWELRDFWWFSLSYTMLYLVGVFLQEADSQYMGLNDSKRLKNESQIWWRAIVQ